MQSLNRSGKSLQEEIDDFDRWLRAHYAEHDLAWRRVAVYERPFGPSYVDGWAPGIEIDNMEAFEPRFRQILRASAGGWVNLEAETISGDVLIVALVWRPSESERTLPVSVNRSGLTQREVELLTSN